MIPASHGPEQEEIEGKKQKAYRYCGDRRVEAERQRKRETGQRERQKGKDRGEMECKVIWWIDGG
jgi:hypothetical protein